MLQTNYVRYKYTPDEMSEDEFLERFVVREDIFNDIFEDLKSSDDSNTNQHYIIIGQRGQGKTTLLRKLQIEVKNDDELSKFLLPIKFAEEQYQIRSLCRLWEEVAEYLQTLYEYEFSTILDDMEKHFEDDDYDLQCFSYLESVVKAKGKKLLLLIDNVDELIGKLSEKEQRRLREILISSSIFRIVGGSTKMLEHHHDYSKAFYEYFKIIKLKSLNSKESREFLLSIARDEQKEKIQNVIENSPARIETLRRITGGVPRTLVMLFDIFLDEDGNAFDDLLKILDEATPLYKHRMDDLPSGLQEIVHTIAINWDGMLTNEIAKKTRESSKSVSAQLKKLEKYEIVESESIGKNKIYKIKERFFNIWYLMRFGRKKDRQRVEWLVKFLEAWCTEDELEERAVKFIGKIKKNTLSPIYIYNMTEALSYAGLDIETEQSLKNEARAYLRSINSNYGEDLSDSDLEIIIKSLDKIEEPEEALKILLSSNKNSAFISLQIATCYVLKNQYDLAEVYIKKGVTKIGDNPEINDYLTFYLIRGIGLERANELIVNNNKISAINRVNTLLWKEKFSKSYKEFLEYLEYESCDFFEDLEVLYLTLLISKGQYYQAKKFLEMPEYQLKERYKPIWYALMTLMQDDFPNEIKKMGSELKESVDEVLKEIEVYKEKYAI
ncbi:ATP-binding protein [Sulfurimonas sp.]|uniref:ATP-binding protein n=1 Tax=Sulfurimonas sp. TaxID=2022749 RepID=UPI002B461E53|nr:ATP-binding protein [Sulfurimonas sp.]